MPVPLSLSSWHHGSNDCPTHVLGTLRILLSTSETSFPSLTLKQPPGLVGAEGDHTSPLFMVLLVPLSLPRLGLPFPWQRHQEDTPPSFHSTCRLACTCHTSPPAIFISPKTHLLCTSPPRDTPTLSWLFRLAFHPSQPLRSLFTVTPLTSPDGHASRCFAAIIFLDPRCWPPPHPHPVVPAQLWPVSPPTSLTPFFLALSIHPICFLNESALGPLLSHSCGNSSWRPQCPVPHDTDNDPLPDSSYVISSGVWPH